MLYAKLAKHDDRRIVCGACGNGLAWVIPSNFDLSSTNQNVDRFVARPDVQPAAFRYVLIPEGWFPDDQGVWRPTERAKRQLRRGYATRNRRSPQWLDRGAKTREGRALVARAWSHGEQRDGFILTTLPRLIVCLYCEMLQELDAGGLRASTFEFPTTLHRPTRGFFVGAVSHGYIRRWDANRGRWDVVAAWSADFLDVPPRE